jgi:hypothetical protein
LINTQQPGTAEKKPMVRTVSDQGLPDHSAKDIASSGRPGSDSQRDRPGVSSSTISDTFPGSASQRVRPNSDRSKTKPDTAAASGTQAGLKPVSSSTGLNKVWPSPVLHHHSPPTGDSGQSSSTADDSKKQAWEG